MRRLVYALVSSLLACGGSHDPANPAKDETTDAGARDAGQRAVVDVSPPVAAANMVCETLATCSDGGAYVSMRECVKQMSERFTNETSAECYGCLAEITCAGWQKCEGANLQGMTCNTLAPGSSGVLGCSRVTCRYDTTMCVAKPTTGADAGA